MTTRERRRRAAGVVALVAGALLLLAAATVLGDRPIGGTGLPSAGGLLLIAVGMTLRSDKREGPNG